MPTYGVYGSMGKKTGVVVGAGVASAAPNAHFVDGVTLSDTGYGFIKDLLPDAEPGKRRGPKKKELANGTVDPCLSKTGGLF
jgi:hypothetical protein